MRLKNRLNPLLCLTLLYALCGAMPALAAVANPVNSAVASTTPLVIGDSFTIDSTVLAETRRINVFAAHGLALAPDAPLPVLYMPDGGVREDFLHVAGLLQVSVDNGTMRPFMLVGIENTQRRRDLTGPTDNAKDKTIAPVVGGSSAFRRFIKDELMPQVRQRYRTTGETALIGESLAGLFIVETFLLEPQLFDTYMAFDASLWWNDGKLLAGAAARLAARAPGKQTLFLASSGEPGMGEAARQLATLLEGARAPGLRWFYEAMPAENHATIYHPAALKALRTVFKPIN